MLRGDNGELYTVDADVHTQTHTQTHIRQQNIRTGQTAMRQCKLYIQPWSGHGEVGCFKMEVLTIHPNGVL